MVSREIVIESLEQVNDPHVPVSLRRMGMLGDVLVDAGQVTVCVTIPCLGCPAADTLREQIRQTVGPLPGVDSVRVDMQWGAHWQRQDVDPSAHPLLRQYGLQI